MTHERQRPTLVSLGAKGVVELDLVAAGETWGRGLAKDVHSSLKAMSDLRQEETFGARMSRR